MCTVVTEDKSLTGFIKSGVTWLKPLLEYRNWVYSIRDDENRRMNRRMNGSIYFSKVEQDSSGNVVIAAKGHRPKNVISFDGNHWVDSFGLEWHVFTSDESETDAKNYIICNAIDLDNGENPRILIKKIDEHFYQLGVGPFTLNTRKEMLDRLIQLQASLDNGYQLIRKEELEEIQKLWYQQGDWTNSVYEIYHKHYNDEYELTKDDVQLLSDDDYATVAKICSQNGISVSLFMDLLEMEKMNFGFNRRTEAVKQIKLKFTQEYLSLNGGNFQDENQ